MKICLISFDYWGFDKYIVDELENRDGVEAVHINLHNNFKYTYPNFLYKIKNFFLKTFLKKNLKTIERHKAIQRLALKGLEQSGPQDCILIMRPDVLDAETHKAVKQYTKQYYAYLYDSTKRFSIDHLPKETFDKIFSFDDEDVKKHNYIPLCNYIYLPKKDIKPITEFDYNAFIVISADERLATLNKIAAKMQQLQLKTKFIVQSVKTITNIHESIEVSRQEIRHDQLMEYMDQSQVYVDLVRHGHNGLSFRVFEALAYQKKLITTNAAIKNYDFYNPDNILVIDPENISIDTTFFTTPYIPLPESVYDNYTINSWVNKVFFSRL